jgi:hypothetical protein
VATFDDIKSYYENILQRTPSDAEVNSWVAPVTSGALSMEQVKAAFINSPEAQNVHAVTRLYQAAFGRVPDKGGLKDWVNSGKSMDEIADGFVGSQEFINRYGSGNVTEAFVTALYHQVLGRAPDADGLKSWMASGKSAAQIMTGFSESTEFKAKTATATYIFLDNAAKGEESYSGGLFDRMPAQPEPVGQTFTLTANIDNLTGGAVNDTLKGMFDATQIATGPNASSMNNPDVVDGGAGVDTISYLVQGDAHTKGAANAVNPVFVTNVERFVVTNFASDSVPSGEELHTLNLANVSGVTEVVNQKSVSGIAFQNIGKSAAVTVDGVLSGNTTFTRGAAAITDALTINIANGVKAGSIKSVDTNNDATTATINSMGAANSVGQIELTGNAGASHTLTSLTINASTDLKVDSADGNPEIIGFDATKDATVTVKGAGKVEIGTLAGAVKTVNAADHTGGLTIVGGTKLQEVTSGSSKDSITLGAALADKGFVKTGAGDDKVDIGANAVNKGAVIELGDGNDSLIGSGVVSVGAVVDGGTGTDTVAARLINGVNASAFKGFDALDLVGMGATSFDVDLVSAANAVQKIVLSGASGDNTATLQNVAKGVGLEITADAATGAVIQQKGASVVDSKADTFTIAFNGEGVKTDAADKVIDAGYVKLDGIETVTIASNGGDNLSNKLGTLVGSTMEKLVITGGKGLDLGRLDTAANTASNLLKEIDASALTGSLKMNAAAVDGAVTVKLGGGDDIVTFGNTSGVTPAITSTATALDKIVNFNLATTAELTVGKGYDLLKFVDNAAAPVDVGVAADAAGSGTAVKITNGVVDFSGLTTGPTTFNSAVGQLDTDLTVAGKAAAFQYGSNTYLFVQNGANNDQVIELTGVTGVTKLGEIGSSNDFYLS